MSSLDHSYAVKDRTRSFNMGKGRPGTPKGKAILFLPFPVIFFAFSLIIPVFSYVGSLRLSFTLIIQILLLLPVIYLWAISRKFLPDFLIIFTCAWASISLTVLHGTSSTAEPIGIIWLQFLVSYLIGRVYINNFIAFSNLNYLYVFIVLFLFVPSAYEFFTSRTLYLDFFRSLMPTLKTVYMEKRMGFDRVQGAFEHPILYGVFCSSLFATTILNYYIIKNFVLYSIVVFAIISSVFFSLSTGAFLSLSVQIFILIWGYVFYRKRNRWLVIFVLFTIGYLIIDLISNRTPFDVFVSYLTFNTGSSYNRILIWQYGTAEVWRHPLFGIGLNDWERPLWMHSGSMDNFWLVIAVRYGLPALVSLVLAFFIILWRIGRADIAERKNRELRNGFVISMVGVFFAISSVHLWNATFCWLMFLMGSSVFMSSQKKDLNTQISIYPAKAEEQRKREELVLRRRQRSG
jgi:hypothetical protein